MAIKVQYEWDYETVDENGDVIDHCHNRKLSGFYPQDITDTLVLVRDTCEVEGGEFWGVLDRTHAYVENGELPDYFDDGYPVPKRFHAELKRYLK